MYQPTRPRTFLGHPRTLGTLFSLEIWERFSYYGMQAILVYYMYRSGTEGGLGINQSLAVSLVGAYGGSVYLCTILGAWLADRVLGSERVLFYSAIMIMLGHLSLAVLSGGLGLAVGLTFVAIGSGGLKTNTTAIVGTLYPDGDPKRDAGFSLFYMAINIGALVGPLMTGQLQVKYGFHYGFAAAAIGMAIGLFIYTLGRKHIPHTAKIPSNPINNSVLNRYLAAFVVVLAAVIGLFTSGWLNLSNLAAAISYAVIAASIIYFAVIIKSRKITAIERNRVFAFIPLFIGSIAFWALFQQQYTFIAVYAEQKLDRQLFGYTFPAAWVQSINPVFIILFAGLFAAMWGKLGKKQPGTPIKFALALVLVGIAFLSFIPLNSLDKTPLPAFMAIMLIFTWAELLLSPIGLSITTQLAPKIFHTQMVSLFFLSISLGTLLSGILAKYYQKGQEISYFLAMGTMCIVLGICLALLNPWIKRMMQGID